MYDQADFTNSLGPAYGLENGIQHPRIKPHRQQASIESPPIEAVFLPTNGGIERLHNLRSLVGLVSETLSCPIYGVVADRESINPLRTLAMTDFPDILEAARSASKFVPSERGFEAPGWDLGIKRTFILRYCQANNIERILIIDDDIILTPKHLKLAGDALTTTVAAGSQILDFRDDSVVGHISYRLGFRRSPFLSGGFLAMRVPEEGGAFPNVYNDDWFYLISVLSNLEIACLPPAKQLPFNYLKNPRVAGYQEYGELLAEGFLCLLCANRLDLAPTGAFWLRYKNKREQYLQELKTRTDIARERLALTSSLHTLKRVTVADCCGFAAAWLKQVPAWSS